MVLDRIIALMQGLLRDIRFGARMLGRDPGVTATAVVTLALVIGANTAIFSVMNAMLLRPFSYRQPQQLVSLDVRDDATEHGGTLLRYELLRDKARSFEGVAAWANDNFNLSGGGEPVQVPVARVTPNFFSLLGVMPALGRSFSDQEGRPEGAPVVVLSNSIWRSRFGSDPKIVGRKVMLDGVPNIVVGVLPGGVQFPFVGPADVWTPRYFELTLMTPQRLRSGVGYLGFLARLHAGETVARADADLATVNQEYRKENPTAPDSGDSVRMTAVPLRDLVVGDLRAKLWLLMGAVAVLLLIGCANVASLLLSRALARKRELGVRTALGAARGVVIRQLLTEAMLLAIAAGSLGIGLAWIADRAFGHWGAAQLPSGMAITMDARVLLFTIAVTATAGMLIGIFPAAQLSRLDLNSTLREEGRGISGGRSRARLKKLLIVGQVALSIPLLIGAGLLARSFERLMRVDPGFDAHNVLTMEVSLPTEKYGQPEHQVAFFDEVLRRVSALPGVRSAAISAALPMVVKRISPVLPEGQPDVPLTQRPFLDIEAISPQWFRTMRVPLRGGRDFTDGDHAHAPRVVIVNEAFARRFWPGENALGKHVVVGRGPAASEVVGVSADVKNAGPAQDSQPQLYLPFAQLPWGDMNLLVRTAVAPMSMAGAVRAQVAAVDPDQPVNAVQTVSDLMDSSRAQPRFMTLLLAGFSATAVGLAAIGLYAVLAWSVTQRRQEMGIRLALGAERTGILRLIVREGLSLVVVGIFIGFGLGLLLTRYMASALYNTDAHDAVSFLLAPVLFLCIAALACYLPARRATRVDPVETLKMG
ncbi:MAG TPA: ABC transporter permease [Silvibacterium sp.]|nr:ABC transporter permease [Silvibacterium sp.]